MTNQLEIYEEWYEKFHDQIYQDFFRLLKMKTVSARKESLGQLKGCANFLKDELESIGFKCTIVNTPFAPSIIAEKIIDPKFETVLFYHHYDVQPEDPFNLWENGPFDPKEKNGAIYARGAQDNKGQLFYTLTALKAIYHLKEKLNVNIKLLIEGEEEIGSIHLKDVLSSHEKELKADHLFVVDSGMKSLDHPVIGIGARGILSYQLTCKTQNTDLHSGEHGGIAYSATKAIVELLAKCFNDDGTCAIDHFYDHLAISHLDPMLYDTEFSLDDYKKSFGNKVLSIHPKASAVESNWIYPTLEINGIWGGYTEEGFKTVLPKEAHAKLSIRTVPNQDPKHITALLKNHLIKSAKKGVEVHLEVLSLGDYIQSSPNAKCVQVAKQAYTDVFKKPCKFSLCGGSIPITAKLASTAKCEAVLIGTGLMSDNIHAPNEHFQKESFKKGFLTIVRILAILSKSG